MKKLQIISNLTTMKKAMFALTCVLVLIGINLYSGEAIEEKNATKGAAVNVMCSPGLYELASAWAGEYKQVNPGAEVKVMAVNDSRSLPLNQSAESIGLFSGNELNRTETGQMWKMVVARDVTVPVINTSNPFLAELMEKGITDESLALLIGAAGKMSWGELLGNDNSHPVRLYISNEKEVLAAIQKFTALNAIPQELLSMKDPGEIIGAVRSDPYAIGFCNMINIKGTEALSFLPGIQLLPIDKNKNGRIDYMENIYDRPDNFARGVWIGKYPKALYTDIYCVAADQPEGLAQVAFLKWVLGGGQQYLGQSGLSELVMSERQSKMEKFNVINILPPSEETASFPVILIISLGAIILASIIISRVIYLRKHRQLAGRNTEKAAPVYFSKHSVDLPKGLYYDKTHTWAFMEKDGMVKIGIDDFLQHVTGTVSRLEMRKAGEKVRKGDMILSIIQNGKRLVVFAPLSGIIKESNSSLESRFTLVNTSPYTDGWVYRIEPTNWQREMQLLEMADKYQAWLSNEFSRLKDFLAGSLKVNKLEYEQIVLQDGGMLKDGVLEDFGPQVWEDFQSNFLDIV
jgi:glycine cleavage system H lipoate-binding protein/ABC-type phosphate transport system substrate-binding protein